MPGKCRRTVQEPRGGCTGFDARQTGAGLTAGGARAETGDSPCPSAMDPAAMPYEPPKHCPHCGQILGLVENRPGQLLCPDAACARITYLSPIPVVAAIVERAGEIILVRSHGWPESWHGLVTGFLEPNESPEEAARRELVEELGLEPGATTLIGAYSFAQMNQVIIAYHIHATGEIKLDETELAGFKIVPLDKLKPWPFGTGAAVRDFLALRAAQG